MLSICKDSNTKLISEVLPEFEALSIVVWPLHFTEKLWNKKAYVSRRFSQVEFNKWGPVPVIIQVEPYRNLGF